MASLLVGFGLVFVGIVLGFAIGFLIGVNI
jgi:hypothetical protein